mgnify:CR=1 FL=1
MVMFILICAQVFSLAFRGLHGEDLIQGMFGFLPGGVNADIWFLMLLMMTVLTMSLPALAGFGVYGVLLAADVLRKLRVPNMVPFVHTAWAYAEGSPDPGGLPYRWIIKAAIPAGFALLALQGLSSFFKNLSRILGGAR